MSVQKAMRGIDVDVWVVDNHSADGSVKMLEEKFPWVHTVANEENVGFSRANNQAIRQSKGEYVLLLNPDTVVQEDTFRKCLDYMDAHSDAGGLGVKMIDGKGNFLPESKRGLPTPEVAFYKMVGLNKLFPRSKRFGKYHLGYIDQDTTADVDVLAGAFMLMRRSVLDEVGLLDETFFMYGEDIDLSYRITQAGYKNVYFPETSIIHYKGESTKRMSANYVLVFYRAMVIFAQKHYESGSARLFTILINLSIYLRAGIALLSRFIQRSWMFFVDAALIVLGLLSIENYWEEHFKNFEDYFSPLYAQTHFPAYTLIWLAVVFWSGGYQRPYSIKRVLRGVVVGTILISAIYTFLPKDLQYSRGIILAGTVWTIVALLMVRLVSHYQRFKNFNLGQTAEAKTVIVGAKQERERVLSLMVKSDVRFQFLGFVSIEPEDDDQVLGELERLDDLCGLYKVDEVIFCSKDISSSKTMYWMNKMAKNHVHFKIVPDDSLFIIGSNAKDLNGELYTEEVRLKLAEDYTIRKKRLIDILTSLGLIIPGIVIGWFGKGILKYYGNLFDVLTGRKTWVSYDTDGVTPYLPELKPGVYQVSDEKPGVKASKQMKEKLNYFYARNYRVETDIAIVLKSLLRR